MGGVWIVVRDAATGSVLATAIAANKPKDNARERGASMAGGETAGFNAMPTPASSKLTAELSARDAGSPRPIRGAGNQPAAAMAGAMSRQALHASAEAEFRNRRNARSVAMNRASMGAASFAGSTAFPPSVSAST
jgi:hypothetical protein